MGILRLWRFSGDPLFRSAALSLCLGMAPISMWAQEFKVFDREVQIHGFASQGFVHTDNNNWLTMNTAGLGSGAFTDAGLNASTQVTDKFRIGAQVYDRKLGQLGDWHAELDWAVAAYKFKSWFGIRGGKVKTTLGLYTDTQDLDFLHTSALLPQSVYPTDLRDNNIAHLGGDLYGDIALSHHRGVLSYTAYAGQRNDSLHSGYPYLLASDHIYLTSLRGLQYGADLRWKTPFKGVLIGLSRLNEDLTGKGTYINFLNPAAGVVPYQVSPNAEWTNQYYGQYSVGKLRIDSEYRRYFVDSSYATTSEITTDVRGWYVAGAYRICKLLEIGTYYSRFTVTSTIGGAAAGIIPEQTDTSLPQNHIYDEAITARIDLTRFWYLKVEGHFMNGYGNTYPDGFYPQVNPQGFKPNTNALIVKTGVNF